MNFARHNPTAPAHLTLLLVMLVGMTPTLLHADHSYFQIEALTTERVDGVYRLTARIDYELPEVLLDALANGVDLVIQVEVEVLRERDWWFDEDVATVTQRYQLIYYALSRMYVVRNLNTGVQQTFPSLYSALHAIGQLRDFPLIDASLLDPGQVYKARLQARVAPEELPLPLRARAYLDSDWRPASEWYTWYLP